MKINAVLLLNNSLFINVNDLLSMLMVLFSMLMVSNYCVLYAF